jgi:hypothetical protein
MNDTDSDVLAITQLVNLYGLAVDSQRWKMFDRIFTADVDADYGATSHRTDREQLKADVVHVDGDRAYSVCNGGWRLVRGAADGDPRWDGTGWYADTLMRTPGGWRITRRVCRITWWTGNPLVNETIPGVKFELATAVLRREADARARRGSRYDWRLNQFA